MTNIIVIKLSLFLTISISFAYLSRASLLVPQSHGFYRFFAWECILTLFMLNVDKWFRNPFSLAQLFSWLFLSVSAFLVLHSVFLLRYFGGLDSERQDVPLMGIEKTTILVSKGAYRYIRHPLYSSLLFLAWGIFLKDPQLASTILAIAATLFLIATAKADEVASLRFFGPSYLEYMERTKMFIPFLF